MRALAGGALWLLVTVARLAEAQEIHPLDPPPPEVGVTASGGTGAGWVELSGTTAMAVGGYAAVAHQLGPGALEVRYDALHIEENPNLVRDPRQGSMSRLGVTARLEVGRLGERWVGPFTSLVGWVELGVGRQRGQWADEATFTRRDALVGAGWVLDHRTNGRRGRPTRVGWYFGWRVTTSEALPASAATAMPLIAEPFGLCSKQRPCPAPARGRDRTLLLSCGLSFSW